MNIKKIKIKTIALLFLMFSMVGCEDFLNVNDDPNAVLKGNNAQQLTFSELVLGASLSANGAGFGSVLGEWTFQFSAGWGAEYQILGSAYMIETPWDAIYTGALQDLEDIIQRSESEGNLIYTGIAKTLKVYYYSVLVDLFGDVPYSQANNFLEYPMPVYDPGEEIYPKLFLLLDEAIADLQNTDASNIRPPGDDDLFYGGNVTKWVTFANSLKLKLYNQVRLVDAMFDNAAVNLLISGDLISTSDEDFEIDYYNISTPEARNPGFVEEYRDPSLYFNVDPWLYETMVGANPNILTGIEDPRIPYYWFNPLLPGETPVNTAEYQHDNFASVIFGSEGTNHNADISDGGSVMGIYPIGGRYDDNGGGRVSADPADTNSATGQAPVRILCSYDIYFIRAELAIAGKTSEDASQLYVNGVKAAFKKVNEVVANSGTSQSVPIIHDSIITAYTDTLKLHFDAATDAKKMEMVLTQKWLANFGNSVDQYTDYRRTGYPVMFDPNTMILQYGPADMSTYTEVSRNYPNSLPWPATPLSVNRNAPDQKSIGSTEAKVFWDIDN